MNNEMIVYLVMMIIYLVIQIACMWRVSKRNRALKDELIILIAELEEEILTISKCEEKAK